MRRSAGMTSGLSTAVQGQRRRWRVANPADPSPLGPLPYLIGHLLWRRGLRSAQEAREFLDVGDSLFEDPQSLPDVDKAVRRFEQAQSNGESVAVYGDFDADGVTGTALLHKALRRYGLDVIAYIPHRVSEGHGLNRTAIDHLRERGATLIVTVDCGVTDIDQVAYARSLGVDTIITDHHLTAARLPEATAVINPHAAHSDYPFEHLTGVGMALKLAQALLQPRFGDAWDAGLMELAAIGAVTDMAPLLGENRFIVHRGIRDLRRTQSAGLRALLSASRVDARNITSETLGFTVGPRLNAAGRLDHADVALELLLTDDAERAAQIVRELDSYNRQRRELTESTVAQAIDLTSGETPPLILVGDASFNLGVVGLAAGKLAEQYGAPAAVYGMEGGRIVASCRSIPGFHWADALSQCSDLLVRYGGHESAAGFACHPDALPELNARLTSIAAERIGEQPGAREGVVDAEAQPHELMGETFRQLLTLEPHGVGNPAPLFLAREVEIVRAQPMGAEGKHFRLTVRSGGALWDVSAFGQQWQEGAERASIIYTMGVDRWNGSERIRLVLEDYAPLPGNRAAGSC